jgi:hypothetical protein
MQEDLEPFGVKIESSLGTETDPKPWGPVKLFGTYECPWSEVEMQGRVREGRLPKSMGADDGKLVGIGGEDPIVRNNTGSVYLHGGSPWTADLESHTRGTWLSLGRNRSGDEKPGTEEENPDGEARGGPLSPD